MIDPFQPGWQLELVQRHAALPEGVALYLLIDGAFVPGLFRQLGGACTSVLLFAALPGCTEDTRDVSPFLVQFDPAERSLARILARCDGLPMVSAIATREDIGHLGQGLAGWCIVEADGQRFNFRFPDTRRLPAIVDVLTPAQRRAIVGSATAWHYIGRDGAWHVLPLEDHADPAGAAGQAAVLDDAQFARLVQDSEADEIAIRLQYRGIDWHGLPSHRHRLLSRALALARAYRLDETQALRWCGWCVSDADDDGVADLHLKFAQWKRDDVDMREDGLPEMASMQEKP